MPRRIIGQCSQSDFKSLGHLSDHMARGEEVDLTTLSKTQQVAVRVLNRAQERDVPWELMRVLKRVLVWGVDEKYRLVEGDMIVGFEFTFFPGMKEEVARFRSLMR